MSRDFADLRADVREAANTVLALAREHDLELLIYCTYRSDEEQARLFRRGRSLWAIEARAAVLERQWGRPDLARVLLQAEPQHQTDRVTWAAPGQSAHGYRMAFDAVPMRDGKPVWGTKQVWQQTLWLRYGICVCTADLEWSGGWRGPRREYPHAQIKGFDWREWIQ